MAGETMHLQPTAPLAPRVLLPDDPGDALALAQLLLAGPKMFNHARGLWGYTGPAADGAPLTIQSTGLGGPSAAIVASELCALGASTLIRIGACTALPGSGLAPGDLLAVDAALPGDGTSRALGATGAVPADVELADALAAVAMRRGTVAGVDVLAPRAADVPDGALALDLQAAALLQVGALHGARTACLLAVAVTADGAALDADGRQAAARALGDAAAAALGLPAAAAA